VRLRDRLDRHAGRAGATRALARVSHATPLATAGLVLAVGLGLTVRGVAPLI
jgi:hypothetical protein